MSLFNLFKKKPAANENEHTIEDECLSNYQEPLIFKLLFEKEPILDVEKILTEAKKYFENINNSSVDDHALLFAFPEFQITLIDATGPAQCVVAITETQALPEAAFQQNWDWSEAAETVSKCKYQVLVTDLLSTTLPYKQRLTMIMNFLIAVVMATKPDAVYSFHGQKLIEPEDLVNKCNGEEKQILHGLCNVRLYNITGTVDNLLLMDTIGLHSIGLPDFTIKFSDFDANDIARLLWNYAYYIYESGDIIENGNTLEGVIAGTKWKCERVISPLNPERMVLSVQGD